MGHTPSTLDGNERLPLYALRVFRPDRGQSYFVRLLSKTYGGLFTHWLKGNSQYCAGQNCAYDCRKNRKVWKGYGAADVWNDAKKLWIPVCFELTEALELDFRDQWRRGSIWCVEYPHKMGKKNQPHSGRFVEQVEEHQVPHAMDLIPCLCNLYHVFEIDLTCKNPMPPKTMCPAHPGRPPTILERVEKETVETIDPKEREEMKARFGHLFTGKKPSTNGKV